MYFTFTWAAGKAAHAILELTYECLHEYDRQRAVEQPPGPSSMQPLASLGTGGDDCRLYRLLAARPRHPGPQDRAEEGRLPRRPVLLCPGQGRREVPGLELIADLVRDVVGLLPEPRDARDRQQRL